MNDHENHIISFLLDFRSYIQKYGKVFKEAS